MQKEKPSGDQRPRVMVKSNKSTGIIILVPGCLAGATPHGGQEFTVAGEQGFGTTASTMRGGRCFKLVPLAFEKSDVEAKLRYLFPNEATIATIMGRWHTGGYKSVIVDFSELAYAIRQIRAHYNRPSYPHRPVHAMSYQRILDHALPDGTIRGLARQLVA